MVMISKVAPRLFPPFYTRFTIRTDDPGPVKLVKIKLLLSVIDADNWQVILREFTDYINDVDDQLVSASIHAIGKCAHLLPDCMQQCMAALIAMINSSHGNTHTETLIQK
jgi:AP-3 complex subunit beta